MNQANLKTEGKMRIGDIAEKENQDILNDIKKLIQVCHLSVVEFCTDVDIETSTYYRYERNESHMSVPTFLRIFAFFGIYMKDHHIECPEDIKSDILRIFPFIIPFS